MLGLSLQSPWSCPAAATAPLAAPSRATQLLCPAAATAPTAPLAAPSRATQLLVCPAAAPAPTTAPLVTPLAAPSRATQRSCPGAAAPAPTAPLAATSRATQLLVAAAAHRTYVERCLAVDRQQQSSQQQLLAEMLEGWMTGEDAIEVAMSHLPSNRAASPELKKGREWTPEEDQLVLGLVELIGTKWSEIVKHLPGRDPDGIKNHFYSNMRRRRRMQLRAELATSPDETGKRKR